MQAVTVHSRKPSAYFPFAPWTLGTYTFLGGNGKNMKDRTKVFSGEQLRKILSYFVLHLFVEVLLPKWRIMCKYFEMRVESKGNWKQTLN